MALIYTNPVWQGYFADPFVLKWRGEYYAYGTGGSLEEQIQNHGRVFPMLHSTDLAHWDPAGAALEPLNPTAFAYWAPEVAERDGKFYLYYSAATTPDDESHRLRVAIADHPAGPFRDVGQPILPDIGFSIDAHPFRDPTDGRWYLYFARDFFDERVGTGTAVIPLADDMMTPAGEPRTVLRAHSDWHIYERNRSIYGKSWDAWHTVEGPFVVEHNARYYCFYSGGAWHSATYGVGYGVAEHPLGPFQDDWSREGPVVLRAIPDKVLGPGHNSVVTGPDDRTPFLVYHAWDPQRTGRRLCIDPLFWTPDGPRCSGPTTTPQPLSLGQ